METISISQADADKFWAKVNVLGVDDCWVFYYRLGKEDKYTTFRLDTGKGMSAHRVAYATKVASFPKHLTIDHLCKVKSCLNPKHLEPVTTAENNRRSSHQQKSYCMYGHPYTEENIYRSPRGDRSCIKCRRERERAYADKKKAERAERGLYKRYKPGEKVIGHNRVVK